jgi:hypothetical protein
VLDTQVDPLVDQASEPLVGCDSAAKLLHAFLADVLRAALHPTGIADLPVGPGVVLGIQRLEVEDLTPAKLRQIGPFISDPTRNGGVGDAGIRPTRYPSGAK